MVAGRAGRRILIVILFLALIAPAFAAEPFRLPTANDALFEPGGEERFFAPTPGKTWTSGCFGCVRSDGWRMHEGLDIRSLQRNRRGEPTDPVLAAADGTVAYINSRAGLSNYGIYVVIRHRIHGLEIFSLYAHLSEVTPGLEAGHAVKSGDRIGTMGRTTNTRDTISKERAHVHFELNLPINERFAQWFRKTSPGQRNDHGAWNGQNMLGIDPKLVFLQSRAQGDGFNLVRFLHNQTELCRVQVRTPSFSWARRYPMLVRKNPKAENEGIAGFEMLLNYNGLPFQLIPRAASEMQGNDRVRLLSVNEDEYRANPCRRLITQRNGKWELTEHGKNLVDLLTY